MRVFLAAILLIGICVLGMCFNIIFRKDGRFPEYEVSKNPDMRRLGVKCMDQEDREIHGGKSASEAHPDACTGVYSSACDSCSLYTKHIKAK